MKWGHVLTLLKALEITMWLMAFVLNFLGISGTWWQCTLHSLWWCRPGCGSKRSCKLGWYFMYNGCNGVDSILDIITWVNMHLEWVWNHCCLLGCTDAAKWPPHPRPTRRRAGDAVACASNRVQFFFFFRFRIRADSRRFSSNARPLAPNRTDSRRFGPNRIVSAEYRCVSAGKRKSAGEKKKNYLKAKIPVDLMRRCRHIHWP